MRISIVSSVLLLFSVVAAQATTRTVNTEIAGPTTVSPTGSTGTTATTSDSRTANTIVSGPTTVSPTGTTGTTATSSDSHTANTIVLGPTTVTTGTDRGQGQTASAFAAPTARPTALLGMGLAAVGFGLGYVA